MTIRKHPNVKLGKKLCRNRGQKINLPTENSYNIERLELNEKKLEAKEEIKYLRAIIHKNLN